MSQRPGSILEIDFDHLRNGIDVGASPFIITGTASYSVRDEHGGYLDLNHMISKIEVSLGDDRGFRDAQITSGDQLRHWRFEGDYDRPGILNITAQVWAEGRSIESNCQVFVFPGPEPAVAVGTIFEYFPPDVVEIVPSMIQELKRTTIGPYYYRASPGMWVSSDPGNLNKRRKTIWRFLDELIGESADEEHNVDYRPILYQLLEDVYEPLKRRQFPLTLIGIAKLVNDFLLIRKYPPHNIDPIDLSPSREATDIDRDTEQALINYTGGIGAWYDSLLSALEPEPHTVQVTYSTGQRETTVLPGYEGVWPDPTQLLRIDRLHDLLTGGMELRIRMDLIRAACYSGMRDYSTSLSILLRLQQHIEEMTSVTLPSILPRYPISSFGYVGNTLISIAVRRALAHLDNGDQLYRQSRHNTELRADAQTEYEAAARILKERLLGVIYIPDIYEPTELSVEVPPRSVSHRLGREVESSTELVRQIRDYAEVQLLKLSMGKNFLGYYETITPYRRASYYLSSASTILENEVAAAQSTKSRFEAYLSLGEEEDLNEDDIEQQREDAVVESEIAANDLTIAQTRVTKARVAYRSVVDQERYTLVEGGIAATKAVAAFYSGGPAAGISASVGLVGISARYGELQHTKKIAEADIKIAELELTNAELRTRYWDSRIEFIENRRRKLKYRNFNADLFFALAATYEKLTIERLNRAIEEAYVAERTAAYELGDDEFPRESRGIQFEYIQDASLNNPSLHGFLVAPDSLQDDITEIMREWGDRRTGTRPLQEVFSLKDEFSPEKLATFRRHGKVEFFIDLYWLEKKWPGYYNRRIERVEVKLSPSSVAATVPTIRGELIHRGPFLLRDLRSTPDPQSQNARLVPTTEQVDSYLATNQSSGSYTVGGVTWYNPTTKDGLDTMTLTLLDTQEEQVIYGSPPDGELRPLTGYGMTGSWCLEVPPNRNSDFSYDQITEISFVFYLTGQYNEPLGEKVDELVRLYEKELEQDPGITNVGVLSMAQGAPEILQQLQRLNTEDVCYLDISEGMLGDVDVLSTRVQAVVVALLGAQDTGIGNVQVRITKSSRIDDTYLDEVRTTHPNGYTEDVVDIPVHGIPQLEDSERVPVGGQWNLTILGSRPPATIEDVLWMFIYDS